MKSRACNVAANTSSHIQSLIAMQAFRTRAEQAEKERDAYKAVVADDCEKEEMIRTMCKPILGEAFVDGDTYGVPGTPDLVEKLIAKLAAAEQRWKEAKPFLGHAHYCAIIKSINVLYREGVCKCSCGLNEFLKKGEG